MEYNLEKRTRNFSKNIIGCSKNIRVTILNSNIISQLFKSSTSIGANYHEANGAVSKNDFINKIHICRKETQETVCWLELLAETDQNYAKIILELQKEASELARIFNKISYSSRH